MFDVDEGPDKAPHFLCVCYTNGSVAPSSRNRPPQSHPAVELRANLKSISHRYHLFDMAFVLELN